MKPGPGTGDTINDVDSAPVVGEMFSNAGTEPEMEEMIGDVDGACSGETCSAMRIRSLERRT